VVSGLPPSSIGSALISTPLSIRNCSRPGPANEGTVVVKVPDVLEGGLRKTRGSPFGGVGGVAPFSSAGG